MKNRFFYLVGLIVGLVILVGCSTAASTVSQESPMYAATQGVSREEKYYGDESVVDSVMAGESAGAVAPSTGDMDGYAPEPSTDQTANRMVIRESSLLLVVDDVTLTAEKIASMSARYEGYLVSSNLSEQEEHVGNGEYRTYKNATIQLRVASKNLEAALREIKSLAVEVKSDSQSGRDVTSDYVDLESRIKNLEAAEAQLDAIMLAAKKTEDVLSVYHELVAKREEIELLKGQRQYLSEATAYSLITVTLRPNIETVPIQVPSWSASVTAKRAVEQLAAILQNLADAVINFSIICLPFLIVVGIPVALLVMWLRRNRRTSPRPTPPTPPSA